VKKKYCVRYYEECSRALFGHRREGAVEFVGTSGFEELKLHFQRLCRDLQFCYRGRMKRIGGVRKDGHSTDPGGDFLEQLQFLAEGIRSNAGDNPVMFPPGRARLSMSPTPTGSPKLAAMIGMVPVAFLAANVAGVDVATMMSTL
jgi:hypothetical protein